ncbi:unnamed protein product [Boreogadus saida]
METGSHAPPLVGDNQHEDPAHNLTPDKVLKQEVTRSPEALPVATECPVATVEEDELSVEERQDIGGYLDVKESSPRLGPAERRRGARPQQSAWMTRPAPALSAWPWGGAAASGERAPSAGGRRRLEAGTTVPGASQGAAAARPCGVLLVKWITWKEKKTPSSPE